MFHPPEMDRRENRDPRASTSLSQTLGAGLSEAFPQRARPVASTDWGTGLNGHTQPVFSFHAVHGDLALRPTAEVTDSSFTGDESQPGVPQIELQNDFFPGFYMEQPNFPINGDGMPSQCIDPSLIQKSWIDEAGDISPPGLVETLPGLNTPDSVARGPVVPPALQGPTQSLPKTPTRNTRAGQRPSAGRTKISDEAKDILLGWYNEKKYPSKTEQDIIATLTKLSSKTVKTWFDNRRTREARHKSCGDDFEPIHGSGGAIAPVSALHGPNLDTESVRALSEKSQSSSISIERWINQPMDEDPVSATAIQAHMASPSFSPMNTAFLDVPLRSRGSSIDSQSEQRFSAAHTSGSPSLASNPPLSSRSSNSNNSSGKPRRQGRPIHSGSKHNSRQSSQRSGSTSILGNPETDQQETQFWCTYQTHSGGLCRAGPFKQSYDWKRHEESVHWEPYLWTCCDGLETFPPANCLFCQEQDVDSEHMRRHKFFQCISKVVEERAFARKDLLKQHIKQCHHQHKETTNPRLSDLIDEWKRPNPQLDPRALHCGFCGRKDFLSWDERAADVIQHFKNGLDLSDWWSARADNEFRPSLILLAGTHPGISGQLPCRCSPDMKEHITDHHPSWSKPCQCSCCRRVYPNWSTALRNHPPICSYWSCSFLKSANAAFYGFPDGYAACCFCDDLDKGQGEVAFCDPEFRLRHLVRHNFRTCNQDKFYSFDSFVIHLMDMHGLTRDLDSIGLMYLRTECYRSSARTFKPCDQPSPTLLQQGRTTIVPGQGCPRHRRGGSRGIERIGEVIAGVFSRR